MDQENGYRGSRSRVHDEEGKSDKVNSWSPITNSRSAKWYYSAFHNVTAMVGAGVLALPYSISRLGWGLGISMMVLSWVITLFTAWQMVEMHEIREMPHIPGKRFNRYHELGQEAFGNKLGIWVVVPQQLIVELGVNVVYMVLGGQSLQNFHNLVACKTKKCKSYSLSIWIIIFALPHFILSQLPNINAISGVSLAAAIMSVSYSAITFGASIHHGSKTPSSTTPNGVFEAFNALGSIVFAHSAHNVLLEIQATLPSTPEKPSKVATWKGVIVAYIIVGLCYFSVAISGCWAFGIDVEDNILKSLKNPTWLTAIANLMVVVHLIGGYQIYAMPVFDMMENLLVSKAHVSSGCVLHLVTRSLYVAFTCFLAITFPFFSYLLGFSGGFAFTPTSYFLPCIMWLLLRKPKHFGLSWLANWACIIIGVLLMFVSSIGGLEGIIKEAKHFHFYS